MAVLCVGVRCVWVVATLFGQHFALVSSVFVFSFAIFVPGTIIEVNVTELGLVTQSGKVVWGEYHSHRRRPAVSQCVLSCADEMRSVLCCIFICSQVRSGHEQPRDGRMHQRCAARVTLCFGILFSRCESGNQKNQNGRLQKQIASHAKLQVRGWGQKLPTA